jgi:FkbM family methyltransferase
VSDWFSNLALKIARVADFVGSIGRQNYTVAERLSVVRARRTHGLDARLLNFQVSFLAEGAYQLLLREIFFKGEYFFKANTDSPTIFDCGANIGLATLYFKHIYPNARISSFEADPTTAQVLKKNVDRNHLQNVSVHNLMLSNAEGDHPFYTAAGEAGVLSMSANPERTSNCREIIVKAGKLSAYIDGPVDLVKLDVEGAEWDVMTDLKNSGKLSLIRRLIIEYHHKIGSQASCLGRFLSLLEEEGFEYQIAAAGCDPIARQGVCQDILIGAYRSLPNEGLAAPPVSVPDGNRTFPDSPSHLSES